MARNDTNSLQPLIRQLSMTSQSTVDIDEKKYNVTVSKNILTNVYNKHDLPLEIGLRLSIEEITAVNTTEQSYGVKGTLSISWKTSNVDAENKANNIEYKPSFVPDLKWINNIQVTQYDVGKISIKKGYNIQRIDFNMTFTEEFEVQNFPFDVQDLSIVFRQSHFMSFDSKLVYVPSQIYNNYLKLDKTFSSITHWEILNIDASCAPLSSVSSSKNVPYEIITFRIQAQRKWKGIIYRIISWLAILGIMSCATFGVNVTDIGDRLSYVVTMALTIVAFQFIISNELPQVNYMTLLDKFNLFIFIFILLVIVETTIVGYKENGAFADAEYFDNRFAIISSCLFIFGIVSFVIYSFHVNSVELRKIGKWKPYKTNVMYVDSKNGIYKNEVIQN